MALQAPRAHHRADQRLLLDKERACAQARPGLGCQGAPCALLAQKQSQAHTHAHATLDQSARTDSTMTGKKNTHAATEEEQEKSSGSERGFLVSARAPPSRGVGRACPAPARAAFTRCRKACRSRRSLRNSGTHAGAPRRASTHARACASTPWGRPGGSRRLQDARAHGADVSRCTRAALARAERGAQPEQQRRGAPPRCDRVLPPAPGAHRRKGGTFGLPPPPDVRACRHRDDAPRSRGLCCRPLHAPCGALRSWTRAPS